MIDQKQGIHHCVKGRRDVSLMTLLSDQWKVFLPSSTWPYSVSDLFKSSGRGTNPDQDEIHILSAPWYKLYRIIHESWCSISSHFSQKCYKYLSLSLRRPHSTACKVVAWKMSFINTTNMLNQDIKNISVQVFPMLILLFLEAAII